MRVILDTIVLLSAFIRSLRLAPAPFVKGGSEPDSGERGIFPGHSPPLRPDGRDVAMWNVK